jgi:RHS repeat-associated protein
VSQSNTSGASNSSGGAIGQILTATTTSAGSAIYTVTPSYNGCNGGNFSVTATVNPLPVVSATGQTICSNTATNISLSSNMAGTTYSWTVSQTNASGGTNASGSTIAQTLSATTTSAGTATYTVTPSASGCNGSTIAPVVTINPLPVASASSQSICSNTATSIVLSSTVAGTTYAWTVVQSNTSGATNSSGGTIAQTLAATTTSNGTATYTVTPTANGCNGSTIAPVATVKPLPVASASSQSICSNTATSIVLSSTVAGTTYAWTVVQSNTSGATNSSGGTIAQTLAATTTSNGTATYTVTPTASGCNGATIAPVATVKPLPVASASSQTICSGTVTSIVLSSNLAGTTYAWTAAQTNTTGATNSSGGTIAQTLIATTINNGTVTYTVTPTANACNGATIAPVATVKPNPVATAPNQSMFVGGSSNVTITSNLSGTTFTYSVSTSTNVSNATSGSGSTIVQPLTSTDGINPGSATYTVTPTASACTGSTTSCVISVYPVPVALVNGATSSPAVTYYNNFGYASVLSTKTFYYSYQWYNNGVLISGATSSSYTPTLPGAYTVQVTGSAGGILSPFSSTVNVAEPGVQGDSVNSVSQTVFYKAGLNGTTSPFTLQANDLIQKITFTDGLGRAVQVVGVGQSPANGDIIIPTVPGRSGLTDSTFLPYVTSSVQGSFRHNAVRGSAAGTSYTTSEQYLFYQQAATTKLPSDANPFARVVLRNTPDARVIEQGAPGTAWQPGSTHTVINKQYLSTSTLYPVLQWKADGTTTGYYPDNTVWVTKVTDENNHRVIVYKNKLGQTVLKQVRADAATWLLTYYIYDNYGQLIYQIPPKAMSILGGGTSLNANVSSVAELIYKYTYDARGRLIQKKVPGSAVSYTVYDQLDRVVLTQDANQRAQGVWMFVKYDYKNRPVYIGQMASASDRATLQSQFDAINYSSQPYFETPAVNATYQGYTNNVFPTTGLTVLSAYYYDNYDFDRNGTADYAYDNTHLAGLPATASTATRGLPTGSKKLILGTANWLVAAKFYDNLDRPLQTQSNNHLNLLLQDKTSVLYFTNNLSTKVQKIKSTHTGTTTVSVTQRYTYDNGWRPVGIYHTINANAEQQVAAYQYNALGQVVMKQLHNTGAAFMQNVDLRYNIRGWLTSINNAQLASDANVTNGDTNDYFGMELFYNNAETSSLGNNTYFNGNISAIKWKNGGVASGALDQRSYKYNYDSCDRLLSATFQANSGSAWNKETGTLNETMTYDANGNIATLLRTQNQRGLTGTTVTSAAQTIDNLSYTYSSLNPNRLAKVDDASGSALGFTDGTPATNEYKYDTLGNLTVDKNKGISAIAYNVLGKPTQITYSNGNTIVYTYDAAGTKLKMASTVSGITTTTDYVNGFVYANAALSFFPSPEGRVVKNGGNYEYQYALTDHQGNTRVVFTSAVQTVQSVSAGFETANQTTEASNFSNYPTGSHINTVATNAHGGSNSLYLNGGPSGQVGVAKSYKVFAGDQLSIQAYAKYLTPSGTGSNLAGFATALLGAFGLSAPVGGETGTPSAGINTWGGIEAGGYGDGSTDNVDPKVFVTIVIFDKNYKFLDVAYQQLTTSGALMSASYKVKEAGYAFMYVSNEHPTQVDVYFDDVTMSYTPSNIIQSNEFLPFGLQTANSWTRDSNTGNNFLANGGTELNTTTQVYDLAFRNYDATLGRMNQVDPFADMMGSFSPYHFAFNNPVGFNDPSGLIPPGAIAYGTWDAGSDWNMGTMDQIRAIGGGGGKGALPDGVYYDQQRNPYSVLNGTVYIPSPGYKNDPNFDMVPAQEIIDLGDPNQNQRYVARAMAAMNAVGDYLDPSTIGHNLFWLSYPGGNNPHSYNGEDNFTYKPKNKAEFPAIGHDRRYYNVGASGATGLLTNTKTIGADWLFVAEELSIANDPSQEFEDRVAAFILGKGLGALAYPKTVYQLIFNPSAIIPDFIQSNKGVTNSPTSTGN